MRRVKRTARVRKPAKGNLQEPEPAFYHEPAFALNVELARDFNQALKLVDQTDDEQDDWYWQARGEIHAFLDTLFLFMKDREDDPDEEPATLKVIAEAARKYYAKMYERWRKRHLAILEDAIRHEAAFEPPRPKRPPAKWSEKSAGGRG